MAAEGAGQTELGFCADVRFSGFRVQGSKFETRGKGRVG